MLLAFRNAGIESLKEIIRDQIDKNDCIALSRGPRRMHTIFRLRCQHFGEAPLDSSAQLSCLTMAALEALRADLAVTKPRRRLTGNRALARGL